MILMKLTLYLTRYLLKVHGSLRDTEKTKILTGKRNWYICTIQSMILSTFETTKKGRRYTYEIIESI